MNQLSILVSTIFGIFLIAGGIMAYVRVGSENSLVFGVITGAIILLAVKMSNKKPKMGYLFIAAISLILAMFFSMRFASTHAFMPAGLMLILSTTTLVMVGLGFVKNKK